MRAQAVTIAEREENVHDLPPVPPIANPDWHNVWQPNPESEREPEVREAAASPWPAMS